MTDFDEFLIPLERGQLYSFRGWPNRAVPPLAAGVYTIWQQDKLIYVGMAGRSLTAEHVAAGRAASKRGGLFSRLSSHAAGRRSGDQFCVYVADRLVLPTLSKDDLVEIGYGRHSLDALVRTYIHSHLSYRFVIVDGGAEARELESRVGGGGGGGAAGTGAERGEGGGDGEGVEAGLDLVPGYLADIGGGGGAVVRVGGVAAGGGNERNGQEGEAGKGHMKTAHGRGLRSWGLSGA